MADQSQMSSRAFNASPTETVNILTAEPEWAWLGVSGVGALNCERAALFMHEAGDLMPPLPVARRFIGEVVQRFAEQWPKAELHTITLTWVGGQLWRVYGNMPD